ncbi:MAG: helix-turn-helix domain-containing protein [Planctomycetaceae bacterium]|nr:helix-turn-helix domain-containing protein [Planctomycetaceae bacterium]
MNLSEKTIRRYVSRGKIPSWQPGGEGARILIPASCLQDFSNSAPQKSPAENQPTSLPKNQKLSGPVPLWKRT